MPRFIWKDSYLTGHPMIDRQHKQLLELANHLYKAVHEQKDKLILKEAFNALLLYTQHHFEAEEEAFAEQGFPLLDAHRELHTELVEEVRSLWREDLMGSWT
ncbi:bacteriohemerythrin [Magnetospira sp. QH-2]|uniref:bacteriohemerythrin n=1 Tax=Magnetospira sp. (strain QH-2) TaxID=1288970 RepID=UPI0003E812CE|nr:hemerythrin domain-containing protein [Magnetospira sp. QH-2]CCQ74902.1 putative bacteriohemerythrin [Magnetospira sp. QH-2]